jgi:hypothetical protein
MHPKILEIAWNSSHELIRKSIEENEFINELKLISKFRYIADLPARSKMI